MGATDPDTAVEAIKWKFINVSSSYDDINIGDKMYHSRTHQCQSTKDDASDVNEKHPTYFSEIAGEVMRYRDIQHEIEYVVAKDDLNERASYHAPQSYVQHVGFVQTHEESRDFDDKKWNQD